MNKWNSSKADFLAGNILVFGWASWIFRDVSKTIDSQTQPHQASSFAVTFQPSKKVEANGRLGAVGIKGEPENHPSEKENHLKKLSKPLVSMLIFRGVPQTVPIDWQCEAFTWKTLDKHPSFQVPYETSRAYFCRDSIVSTKLFSIWESSSAPHQSTDITRF